MGSQGTHRSVIINGDQPKGFALTVSDQNKFRPHVQVQSGWAYFDGNITVELDTWYNVVATYDEDSNLKLYVDGVLDSMFTQADKFISGPIVN